MAESNPFAVELTNLAFEIMDLKAERDESSGAAQAELGRLIEDKQSTADELYALSSEWSLGKTQEVVARIEALASSELARQARVVARLRRIVQAVGGKLPSVGGGVSGGGGVPVGPHVQIRVTDRDADALSRLSKGEAGGFERYGKAELAGGVEAVVETVLNRVAHKSWPDSIEEVIDQKSQFSPINSVGSWTGLKKAPKKIQRIVEEYLEARVAGTQARLEGATHFLNPYTSSSGALKRWGNYVVDNAVAKFGSDDDKFIHYHGRAQGVRDPRPHAIHYKSWSPVFDGRGHPVSEVALGNLRERIVARLHAERDYFGNGAHTERDDPYYKRVGDYWQAVGVSYNGRTRKAWSAAFISWIIVSEGIGRDRFRPHAGHCRYVEDILEGKLDEPLFAIEDPDTVKIEPGDLVHFGRKSARHFTLSDAKLQLIEDEFYLSHSDFVVSVDPAAGHATTIGGNVSHSVQEKRIGIDRDGRLTARLDDGEELPWIAVLKPRV